MHLGEALARQRVRLAGEGFVVASFLWFFGIYEGDVSHVTLCDTGFCAAI